MRVFIHKYKEMLQNDVGTLPEKVELVSDIDPSNIPIAGSFETGRVERGEKSNQKFNEIDMEFDNYYISSTILELLPESRKPETASELAKKLKGDSSKKKTNDNDSDTIIDLIKKLGELHSAGILTDEEFSEKKKELLSKI